MGFIPPGCLLPLSAAPTLKRMKYPICFQPRCLRCSCFGLIFLMLADILSRAAADQPATDVLAQLGQPEHSVYLMKGEGQRQCRGRVGNRHGCALSDERLGASMPRHGVVYRFPASCRRRRSSGPQLSKAQPSYTAKVNGTLLYRSRSDGCPAAICGLPRCQSA